MTTQTSNSMTITIIWFPVLAYLAALCVAHQVIVGASGQPVAVSKWQFSGDDQNNKEPAGEKVDRLTSATGDLIWPSASPGQLEWLLQQVPPTNGHLRPQSSHMGDLYLDNTPSDRGLDGQASSLRTYHDDLVDEFKQYARGLVNPNRESRAFKPKLMSTARGFGKRAYLSPSGAAGRITYSDLLEAANPNNAAIQSHGKMSETALSSKYGDWVSQALARWPSMSKYLNDKYLDYNGDGIISMDEKYQSL